MARNRYPAVHSAANSTSLLTISFWRTVAIHRTPRQASETRAADAELYLSRLRSGRAELIERLREGAGDRLGRLVLNLMPL